MSATTKWVAGAISYSSGNGIAGTSLNAMANAAVVVGSAIDNSSNLDQYSAWELICKFQSSPGGGAVMELYLLPSLDGTNYADGAAAGPVNPSYNSYVGSFIVEANTNAQRLIITGVTMPTGKFKACLVNKTAQTTAATNTDTVLTYVTYNDQSV